MRILRLVKGPERLNKISNWKKPHKDNLCSLLQMYNFTSFAMTLNELEPGMERLLAPTDCRLRPDIRAMENGDIGTTSCIIVQCCFSPCLHSKNHFYSVTRLLFTDTASHEKERLEEKQRASRRERSKDEEEWTTRWASRSIERLAYHQDLLLALNLVSSLRRSIWSIICLFYTAV